MKMLKKSLFLVCLSILSLSTSLQAQEDNGKTYLQKTSQAFTAVGKKAIPAAVFIKTEYRSRETQAGPGADPFDLFSDEFFRRFFGSPMPKSRPRAEPEMAGGSGFLVSSDGYILTNYHVVKDASKTVVVLNDGREFEGTLIGSDPKTDLAVIKIDETNLPFLSLGNSDFLEIGEWVVAVGSPFALESSLTVGVVSAKGRQDLGITSLEDFIQTDAAINPGNSGGPLLDLDGNVIGINTAIVTRSGGYMGVGFAIPSNMAKHVMNQIIDTGIVKRAYLGIMLQTLDSDLIEALNLNPKITGILIAEVMKDSPAEKGGLKNGDIILEFNGESVKNMKKFRNEIAMMDPSAKIHLKILRNGKTKNIQLKLGTLTENEISSSEIFEKIGFEVSNLENQAQEIRSKLGFSQNTKGAIITKVDPTSPAFKAGLRPYYLITGVVINWKNQKEIKSTQDLTDAFKELSDKKYVVLIVRHQNYQRYYTVKLK